MAKVRICPKCGKVEGQYTYFCSDCGTKTVNQNEELANEEVLELEENAGSQSFESEKFSAEKNNSKLGLSKDKIIILILSIVVLVSVIIICVLFINSKDSTTLDGKLFVSENEKIELSQKSDDVKLEKEYADNGVLDLTLQGNFSNWGGACVDSENVYFTDYSSGIFCTSISSFSNETSHEMIASGFYTDLGVIDKYIFAIKSENSKTYVVRIDKTTYEEEIVTEEYDSEIILVGQDIVDGKYYYTVDYDRLYYLQVLGEAIPTEYRNVLKMSKYGVFSTANKEYGLEYTSFDDANTMSYDFFSETKCGVAFSDGKTAVVYDYINQNTVYELNLKSGDVTILFSNITCNMPYLVTAHVNATDDYYLLGVTYNDEQNYTYSEVYRISKADGNVKTILSKSVDQVMIWTTTSIINNKCYITWPVFGSGEFYICEFD